MQGSHVLNILYTAVRILHHSRQSNRESQKFADICTMSFATKDCYRRAKVEISSETYSYCSHGQMKYETKNIFDRELRDRNENFIM